MKNVITSEFALPPRTSGESAHQWLYASIRDEILRGKLRSGARLPATRDLARQYGLARGTIVVAFEQLKSEGYVEGSMGSGTYVSRTLPEELLDVSPGGNRARAAARRATISGYGRRTKLFGGYGDQATRAFRCHMPALDLFPMELWTRVMNRCLRRATTRLLMGCDAMGYRPLREAIADYLGRSRGVKCVTQQVAIVSGVQEALDLTARVVLDPGDRVCMEDPGYTGAALVFRSIGAKVSLAGLDDEGIRLGQLPSGKVRLVYVTPGHQFPLGMTMSLGRRLQLLEWARASGAMIFEDDYDSEYRFSGRPIPALQGLDGRGQVVYAGSFSKVLFPGLRLGYLVVPETMVDRVAAVKSVISRHAPILEQAVLDRFLRDGHFARHVRRMRMVYAERRAALMEEARAQASGLLELSQVEAGLQTTAWLRPGISAEMAAAAAAKRGVEVTPISVYTQGPKKVQALQLGFAAITPREIRRGMTELVAALER